ncbi:uncharacterized protein LOC131665778 isoform X2 [Phymastichus coffea]|uniref:uncharacterized protein LOC131665778 isoform X2 n=1 Tax=Phymastichus coffea TaxID=108790 RepID=UPI00273C9A29|nr:uncharacterized protein LOC131665778 isoform X2 [Phymastichus coffea]
MDIASMLEVEVQEVADSKENVIPDLQLHQRFPCVTFSSEENEFYKLTYGSDVASVRFLKLHCTSCAEHIGSAPNKAHNMHEHPVLRVLLCGKCREFYGTGTFEQGDDATDMYCRWCANGGNLFCCSYCSNTFCSACIKRNFDPPTIKRIEEEESWKCFVCDPKDLYPLRSLCRALLSHIETVTRLLENAKNMSLKEIEEKMHLDETKCCSRKRKRGRRRTMSMSDDEEEDTSYVPEAERADSPPAKKRKIRCGTVRNVLSNGYDHEYSNRREKNNSDVDPTDLMMTCEQSMVEGDSEILNSDDPTQEPVQSPRTTPNIIRQQPRQVQFKKIAPNNMAINPVPLANLLKVAISSKQIKIGGMNKKLVAVPMSMVPKGVVTSSINFVKPPTHFLMPKNTMKPVVQQVVRVPPSTAQQQQQQQKHQQQQQSPSVIDLDSDDEPVILDNCDNNCEVNNGVVSDEHVTITDQIEEIEETFIVDNDNTVNSANTAQPNSQITDDELVVISEKSPKSASAAPPVITVDGMIPLKTQQRDQRFKKMLVLQSQEIDSTIGKLKTKVLKLMQLSNNRPQHDEDLLNSAAMCTKRFHRAMRKALVELSQINDRLVKDYLHWRKNSIKSGVKKKSQPKEDIPLEMICVRESASESDNDDDDDDNYIENFDGENRVIEGNSDLPPEFATILDHLTIFKRKVTAVKGIGGNASVWTEDKACQVDDVPWRDYEKCIGYSLLTRSDYDPETKEEILRPVVTPDENFGKYQEQFLFYLQHIEDHGIETDDSKGLADPNQIPLKDLIDGTSPFITDMLERLSPVTLSNGGNFDDSDPNIINIADQAEMEICLNENETPEESEKKSEENAAPTSKAVEELVKMVTKLNEDLRSEQVIAEKKTNEEKKLSHVELEQETRDAVNSILHVVDKSYEVEHKMDTDMCTSNDIADDDCTTID